MRDAVNGTPGTARVLRRTMSLPEVMLWRVLRTRPHGLKFRRQHHVDRFVLYFLCSEAGLAIEIDGEAHDRGNRPDRDHHRDRVLQAKGIATLRIAARDVLHDLDAVVRQIVLEAGSRAPLHHPASPDGPPPRGKPGED